MTVVYTTKLEKELLDLCKDYIRIMNCTPSQFCEELYGNINELHQEEAVKMTKMFENIQSNSLNS